MASKKARSSADKPKQVTLTITLAVNDETATYYLNTAEVVQSYFEFSLLFGKVPAKFAPGQLEALGPAGGLELPATLQVLVPPLLIPGLIRALTTERQKYEEIHGMKLPEPQGEAKKDG